MMRSRLFAGISIAFVEGILAAQQNTPKSEVDRVFNVCDVLRDLKQNVSKQIAVMGVFGWDSRHGTGGYLTDDRLDPYEGRCSICPGFSGPGHQ